MKEADKYGVEIKMNSDVKEIIYKEEKFHIELVSPGSYRAAIIISRLSHYSKRRLS